MTDPTVEDARRVTGETLGIEVVSARRFTTGLHHFVYEVDLADGRAVVMRMTRPSERQAMRNAVMLSKQLLPSGVPLPRIIAADMETSWPWMLLERLAGVDLGEVVAVLPDACLAEIAAGVAKAQHMAAKMPNAGRYGYAAAADEAPFERWSRVIEGHVRRSRERIAVAGLLELAVVERVESLLAAMREELDAMPATPFLHDTTTKNVIVAEDGTLTGIVDVDDLCFGDPRYVAALTRVALMAHDLPTFYADELMRGAGWVDDRCYRLYVAAFLLDFMSEHGQVFNGNQRPSSAEHRAKLRALYEESLAGA